MNLLREKQRAIGAHRLQCADEPDLGLMQQAAMDNVQLGREAMQWYQKAHAEQQPLVQRAADTAEEVSRAQLASMKTNDKLAADYDQYRRTTFQPVEEKLVDDAMTFNTDGERERLAGLAGADTAQSFGAARSQLVRDAGRAGVNPADGGFGAGMAQLGAQEALATSFSKNKARQDAKTLGRAMLMDSASLGRNLASQQATSAGLALNAGTSAVGNAGSAVAVQQQATNQGAQGYGMAMKGNESGANIWGQQAKIGAEASASNMQALGQVAGMGMMMMSDENEKEDVKPTSGRESLEAVRKTPVKKWKYRKDSVAADGGQEHTGPMAQDVRLTMGDQAAPAGKLLDPVTMQGITLAAVQELDRKVARLEKKQPRRLTMAA
jgi:hypothetical protein